MADFMHRLSLSLIVFLSVASIFVIAFSMNPCSSSTTSSRCCTYSQNLVMKVRIQDETGKTYSKRDKKDFLPIISKPTSTSPNKQQKRLLPQGKPREKEINNPNKLRIIGGIARGRKIDSPDVYLRPMMAKVRAAVFSSLNFLGVFDSKVTRVLDLFAGAGSVGLESLSRGASHATYVDFSEDCVKTCLQNTEKCGFKLTQVQGICGKVEDVLANPQNFQIHEPYHFISVTPPYREVSYPQLIELLCSTPLIQEDTVVLIEYPVEMGTLPYTLGENSQMIGLRNRRYGRTVLAMYINRPSSSYDFRPDEFIDMKDRKLKKSTDKRNLNEEQKSTGSTENNSGNSDEVDKAEEEEYEDDDEEELLFEDEEESSNA